MIPTTYPSEESSNVNQMIVYIITDVEELQEWIDYIPVKQVTSPDASLANTYDNEGYLVVKTLASIEDLVAFKDYIPVYEKTDGETPWSTDATGYIPVDIPT